MATLNINAIWPKFVKVLQLRTEKLTFQTSLPKFVCVNFKATAVLKLTKGQTCIPLNTRRCGISIWIQLDRLFFFLTKVILFPSFTLWKKGCKSYGANLKAHVRIGAITSATRGHGGSFQEIGEACAVLHCFYCGWRAGLQRRQWQKQSRRQGGKKLRSSEYSSNHSWADNKLKPAVTGQGPERQKRQNWDVGKLLLIYNNQNQVKFNVSAS